MENPNNAAEPQITPEKRELLIKYFANKPPEKSLTPKEFGEIKDLINRKRGGLTKEAYELVKDDKVLVKAAAISQVHKDHRVMEGRVPEVRDTLLKALQAKPGEKNLTPEEFKKVAVFLDRKNGGLRHHAFKLFKDDKEITQAASDHRTAWKADKAASQEAPSKPESKAANPGIAKLQKLMKSRSAGLTAKGKSQGIEMGD